MRINSVYFVVHLLQSILSILIWTSWSSLPFAVVVQGADADDGYSDEYYGYEEEAVSLTPPSPTKAASSQIRRPEPEPIPDPDPVVDENQWTGRGFDQRVGGGIVRIPKPLVDPAYINMTVSKYKCIPQSELVAIIDRFNMSSEFNHSILHETAEDAFNRMLKISTSMHKNSMSDEEQARDTENDKKFRDGFDSTFGQSDGVDESGKPKKRQTFREIQEAKLNEKRELKKERESYKPRYLLGSDCESLVCGSCKVIVEEFGKALHLAVNNPRIRYVEQVFNAVGSQHIEGNAADEYCESKEIKVKYDDIVYDICNEFKSVTTGFGEALLFPFEEDKNYNTLASPATLYQKKEKICTAIGACDKSKFQFRTAPKNKFQDHWNETCYVCQAFAYELEERIHLSRYLTERTIIPVVKETCDRLQLEAKYDEICRTLVSGKLLDDIAWLAKVHEENIIKQIKSESRFADSLCEEVKYCKKYIDPEQQKQEEMEEEMEAVFF